MFSGVTIQYLSMMQLVTTGNSYHNKYPSYANAEK